jgi:hypothetical protein
MSSARRICFDSGLSGLSAESFFSSAIEVFAASLVGPTLSSVQRSLGLHVGIAGDRLLADQRMRSTRSDRSNGRARPPGSSLVNFGYFEISVSIESRAAWRLMPTSRRP